MCKLEENKLNEGDRDETEGSFGSIPLSEAINQPLFKKSKSQVMFLVSMENQSGLFGLIPNGQTCSCHELVDIVSL